MMARDIFEWAYSKGGHDLKTFPAAPEDDIYHAENWKQFDAPGALALKEGWLELVSASSDWGGLVLNEIDSTSEEISEDKLRAIVTDRDAIIELVSDNRLVMPIMPNRRFKVDRNKQAESMLNDSRIIMQVDDGDGGKRDLDIPVESCTYISPSHGVGDLWLMTNEEGWATHYIAHEGEAISLGLLSVLTHQTAKIRSTTYRMAPTINMKKSLLSRVKATRVNLSRDMLLKSLLLRKGVVFSFDESYDKVIRGIKQPSPDIDGWGTFSVFVYPYRNGVMFSLQQIARLGCLGTDSPGTCRNYYLSFNRLPLRLDKASIKSMFKPPRDNKHMRKAIIHRDRIYEGIKQSARNGEEATDVQEWFAKAQLADQMGAVLLSMSEAKIEEMVLDREERNDLVRDLLPFIMKLIVAYSSPELRGDLKRKRAGAGKKNGAQANGNTPKQLRQYVWGNDRVVYIYPDSTAKGGPRASCYVRPHHCTFLIKNTEKYKEYDLVPRDDRWEVVKWREGHFRGSGDFTLPEFNAGAQPRSYSRKAIAWLKRLMREQDLFIQHAENMGELHLPIDGGRYYKADGYCKTTNTIYEFYGDYWHGNPEIYSPDDTNNKTGKTMGELYENTVTREQALRNMGFNVVTVWESDYDRMVRA